MPVSAVDLAAIRARAAAATPGPWRWHGWMSGERFVLPELEAPDARVLAFTERDAVRAVYTDGHEPASVEVAQDVRKELLDDLQDTPPPTIAIDDTGARAPGDPAEPRLVAYAERGMVMHLFDQASGNLHEVGSPDVPLRWDCYRGQTTEEAGREPYRHNIAGVAHPDAEFIAHSRQDIEALLAALDEAHAEIERLRVVAPVGEVRYHGPALTAVTAQGGPVEMDREVRRLPDRARHADTGRDRGAAAASRRSPRHDPRGAARRGPAGRGRPRRRGAVVALLAGGVAANVLAIGKPRAPTTPPIALGVAILNSLVAWAVIELATRHAS